MPQPLEFEQGGYNSPDGLQLGRTSSERLGCYGVTPVTRLTVSTSDVSTVSSQSTSSGAGVGFGFPSLADYNNVVTAVSTIQAQLKLMGIIP